MGGRRGTSDTEKVVRMAPDTQSLKNGTDSVDSGHLGEW